MLTFILFQEGDTNYFEKCSPYTPSKNKIDNKITTIMIKAYLQIVIIIKVIKNSRDLKKEKKDREVLKTEINTLVKKGIQSTMIFKNTDF